MCKFLNLLKTIIIIINFTRPKYVKKFDFPFMYTYEYP